MLKIRPIPSFLAVTVLVTASVSGQSSLPAVLQKPWFEIRSAHFNTYSCGPTQEVAKLTARLEQFRAAYAQLAGTQAVVSPPIVVMAFPDHEAMKPFLPLYEGQPANLAAFFEHSSDENLIATPLIGGGARCFEIIFHEFTHLLFRRNERFWPLWLKEGMAEIYATFEVTGSHKARIGQPLEYHLRLLADEPLLPLKDLFSVSRDSPQYNQREHQGIFYAQSWLLTHYLMLGTNPARRARFGQLTALLRQGQSAEQAFTNCFLVSLPIIEKELRDYLTRGNFTSLELVVKVDLNAPWGLVTRGISPAEACFHLGDQLMRVGRRETAETYFLEAKRLSPASPFAFEGLGLLAAVRHQPESAVACLSEALQHGSRSFLAHFTYAREKFQLTADAQGRFTTLEKETAAPIRAELERSLALMPDFGPALHLLGILQVLQGEDLATGQENLEKAIRLEPENEAYVLSLAQAQMLRKEPESARQTLEKLRLPYVDGQVRIQAAEMLQELGRAKSRY